MGLVELQELKQKALSGTFRRKPLAVGCIRRNWWGRWDLDWRAQRGNAVLSALGSAVRPVQDLEREWGWDADLIDDYLVFFRAGPFKDYWLRDINETWALFVDEFAPPKGIVLFWENNGELAITSIPEPEDPKDLVLQMIDRLEPWAAGGVDNPPRIRKDGDRASTWCRFCPFKARCDAVDVLDEDTDDWPDGYQRGPL